MNAHYKYATVLEAMKELRSLGFNVDFNIKKNLLEAENKLYNLEDFKITEIYRYEGDTNPDEEATVYGIESNDGKKGILITSYGMYTDEDSVELLKQLTIQ